uniref:Uncharacterized protein n=1 Tax=Oryza brachyantha TaxID=4533 RepID=J3KX51_ORYBR
MKFLRNSSVSKEAWDETWYGFDWKPPKIHHGLNRIIGVDIRWSTAKRSVQPCTVCKY